MSYPLPKFLKISVDKLIIFTALIMTLAPLFSQEVKSPTLNDLSIYKIEASNDDATFSPGESTTATEEELDAIYAPSEGYLEDLGVKSPLDLVANPLEQFYQKTGFRAGVANTMLFAQPIGGRSTDYGAAGDLDLMTSWTLVGRGTKDTGRFVATAEYRYELGDQPPSALGRQMGTLIAPVGAFNDRGVVIRDLFWVQRLFEARLRFIIGRAAPDDYVGSYWLQNVNNSFVNRHFSANPGIPFPGHGPLFGVSYRPIDECYFTAGICNAYSVTTHPELQSLFDDWDLFSFGEMGYTPTIENLGAGRYAIGLWQMDARENLGLARDNGFTLIADQNLNDRLQVFARYSYSDGVLTNVRQLGQAGLGFRGILGRENDLTGLAASAGIPRSGNSQNETVVEAFHRFQLNRYNQLSLGLQYIANPGNAPGTDAAGLFYARLRTSF